MGKSWAERIQTWQAQRKRYVCLPPGVKRRKLRRESEPKETMIAAGLRVVLDAPPAKLTKGGYP